MNRLWKRITYSVLGAASCLLRLLAWSVIEPYFFDRYVVVAEIPALPQSWQGKQIAVVADSKPECGRQTLAPLSSRSLKLLPIALLMWQFWRSSVHQSQHKF